MEIVKLGKAIQQTILCFPALFERHHGDLESTSYVNRDSGIELELMARGGNRDSPHTSRPEHSPFEFAS